MSILVLGTNSLREDVLRYVLSWRKRTLVRGYDFPRLRFLRAMISHDTSLHAI